MKDKQWNTAKKLFLNLHLKYNINIDILGYLGDCCLGLQEIDLAYQCYNKCVNYSEYYQNRLNVKWCLRLATVYQIKWQQEGDELFAAQAESLYTRLFDEVDNMSKKNIICFFYDYGFLLLKLKRYAMAMMALAKCEQMAEESVKYNSIEFIQSIRARLEQVKQEKNKQCRVC